MFTLFKSRIFLRQFLYFLFIICLTFLSISFVLLSTTTTSLKKQQMKMVEQYRMQASQSITNWLDNERKHLKSQSVHLQRLEGEKLGSAEIRGIIGQQVTVNRNWLDILIMNEKGIVINSRNGEANTKNFSDRLYFKNGIQGISTVTGFYKGGLSGRPVMAIGEPLEVVGKSRFVIAAIIGLEMVKDIVEKLNFGQWGHAYLVDAEGILITDSEFIREHISHGGVENKEKYKVRSFAVEQIKARAQGSGDYSDFMGERVFGSYEWMETLQVGLIVEFREQDVMKPINDLTRTIGLLTVLVLLIGTLLAFLMSKKIIDPINKLIISIGNIIEHNYHEPVELKTNSELDVLANYFNNLQAAVHEREEHLKERATKDGLTGIYNHSLLIELLEKELVRADRAGHGVSFCMLDIDYFKRINDTYGHAVGDVILMELSGILTASVRKCDITGRYGGEEFSIILPEISQEEVYHVSERIRQSVEEYEFRAGGQLLHITVSIGICHRKPGENIDHKELIIRADQALYKAKRGGRNRVEVYSGETE